MPNKLQHTNSHGLIQPVTEQPILVRETYPGLVLAKLDALRTELNELAFALECRAARDAADVATTVSARIEEICDELARSAEPAGRATDITRMSLSQKWCPKFADSFVE